jgi:hypothetical protein
MFNTCCKNRNLSFHQCNAKREERPMTWAYVARNRSQLLSAHAWCTHWTLPAFKTSCCGRRNPRRYIIYAPSCSISAEGNTITALITNQTSLNKSCGDTWKLHWSVGRVCRRCLENQHQILTVPPAVLFVSTRSLDGHQERIMRSLETWMFLSRFRSSAIISFHFLEFTRCT